jgi:hypothetical protein
MPIKPPGSDWDVNGCIASAGYTFCEILGRCIRVWEEMCEYPTNCLTWNDGCNTCSLMNGELGACTEMYCFQQNTPYCMVQKPEVGIEPWLMNPPQPVIDPMPPVVNPFLGDGH